MAAAGLSLAAQVAVAKPSPSGWLLSAVPALAFMALVKLVLATAPAPAPSRHRAGRVDPAPEPVPGAPAPAPAPVEPAPVVVEPSARLLRFPRCRWLRSLPTAFARRNGTPLTGEVTR